jgi:hypothetical protein
MASSVANNPGEAGSYTMKNSKDGPTKRSGPVPDTLTIPGQRARPGSPGVKKAPQPPIKKIGRKRP